MVFFSNKMDINLDTFSWRFFVGTNNRRHRMIKMGKKIFSSKMTSKFDLIRFDLIWFGLFDVFSLSLSLSSFRNDLVSFGFYLVCFFYDVWLLIWFFGSVWHFSTIFGGSKIDSNQFIIANCSFSLFFLFILIFFFWFLNLCSVSYRVSSSTSAVAERTRIKCLRLVDDAWWWWKFSIIRWSEKEWVRERKFSWTEFDKID